MRGICSPEMKESCPLSSGCVGKDLHHLEYPARSFQGKIEKSWRERDFNKVVIKRCLHNAIHSTGYIPEKPSREVMANELWTRELPNPPLRAMVEREYQMQLGMSALGQTALVEGTR